ncbi:MAG: FtsW/RodA/SpoVE family cell cycle protein [Planctomycetales bacterium]
MWLPLVPIGIVVPLVMLEPDFGTGLFLLLGSLLALFVRGWPLRNFALVCGAVLPLVLFVGVYKPYQLRRITGFVAAWTDLNQAPYQLQQSLATMGAGGLTGTGLGRGWQKLSYLPEANTDFVFAVIGEELGLFGTCAIVGLWLGMFVIGRKMLARGADSEFSFALGITLLVQIVMQAAVNMAVVTALVPPKGISHPLVSRGGSNLLVNLLALGILLSLSRYPQTVAQEPVAAEQG